MRDPSEKRFFSLNGSSSPRCEFLIFANHHGGLMPVRLAPAFGAKAGPLASFRIAHLRFPSCVVCGPVRAPPSPRAFNPLITVALGPALRFSSTVMARCEPQASDRCPRLM